MGVSEEMMTLFEAQRRTHETVLRLQAQIEEEEAIYLEETSHGNIIRGWDGFIDSKQPRKDANPKKVKPYTESEHLFSNCCFYTTLAGEPSFDMVDIYNTNKDEGAGRRKLTVTLSVGKGAHTVSGIVDSTAASNIHALNKENNDFKVHASADAAFQSAADKNLAAVYQASSFKKRKTSANEYETMSAGSLLTTSSAMTEAIQAAPPASDFLDVL